MSLEREPQQHNENETRDKFNAKLSELTVYWLKLKSIWKQTTTSIDTLTNNDPETESEELEEKTSAILIELLNASGEERELLHEKAKKIRDENTGKKIQVRGVIEVSNICRANCLYCPMRRDNLPTTEKIRITPEQIYSQVKAAKNEGITNFFMQSGEDPQVIPVVLKALSMIKNDPQTRDIEIVLNLGDHSPNTYSKLHEAGADGYLIKHETADKELHNLMRPHSTVEQRVSHLLQARQSGMYIGTGAIVGLPGQTDKSLAEDIIFAGHIGSEQMVSCSPFTPGETTPLAEEQAGNFYKTLNMIAVYRLLFPNARIPAVSNLDSTKLSTRPADLKISGQSAGINAGANGITINMTPPAIRGIYSIYDVKTREIVDFSKAKRIEKETGLTLDLDKQST